ncbi:3'(2'),5'-bisphosphate nucleotidase CysQ [Glacieibacterium frigidum]|uniref:3'(2'),5'-bisphosphate nucleotidase CysQ n=2 Tax=Glacieibacterium frigidum TaxID=2593303 RepID=A0A552UJH7_9SPHN|nr:3'(2'),5'-bisphosphate nucleotidase CysQ [Glacieibacterium frigidum]
MRYFRADNTVWDKSPGNPVSDADLAVDAYLKDRLLGARPGYGWLSEETADAPDRLTRDRVWVVDPIDGTRDFIRGRDGWAVSVALIEAGRPVLAALAAPVRGQLFVAVAGRGAHLGGVRLAVSGRHDLAGLGLPIEPHNLHAQWWPEPWDAIAVERPNSIALRTAKVASGECDAWLEGRTVNEWDLAAAALILTEAGGLITDRAGQPLRFNQPDPVIVGVVAATPALHEECRRRLNAGLAALAARRR